MDQVAAIFGCEHGKWIQTRTIWGKQCRVKVEELTHYQSETERERKNQKKKKRKSDTAEVEKNSKSLH